MKANYKEFTITTSDCTNKPSSWNERNTNSYTVTVKSRETGKKTSFDFWCSIASPDFEKEYDVLNALYCFVSDAISGLYSFDEFCGEFGCDNDSRRAERIYKACKRAYNKFQRVSGYNDDQMYEFINELAEIAA